jgi:hypothetical protein
MHPVAILMAEHKVLLKALDDLQNVLNVLGMARDYDNIESELRRISEVAETLLGAESHHQREEQVLFPRLEKYGIDGPPRVMRHEHADLRLRKKQLQALVGKAGRVPFQDFTDELLQLGEHLENNLRAHIYKEENILYPAALDALSQADWDEIGAEFQKLGYCSFTPGRN